MRTPSPAPLTVLDEIRSARTAGHGTEVLPASLDEALGRVAGRIELLPTTEPLRPVVTAAPVTTGAPAPARAWLPRAALLGVAAIGSWAVVIGAGVGIWSVIS